MTQPTSLLKSLRALAASLQPRRRAQLMLILGLMVLGAFTKVLSLGAIVPFLAILADTVQALQRPAVAHVIATLGLDGATDIRWQLTLLFAATTVAAGVVRFVLIYTTAKLNYGIGHELGAEVYRRTLYQPYEVHVFCSQNAPHCEINISQIAPQRRMTQFSDFDLSQMDEAWQIKQSDAAVRSLHKRKLVYLCDARNRLNQNPNIEAGVDKSTRTTAGQSVRYGWSCRFTNYISESGFNCQNTCSALAGGTRRHAGGDGVQKQAHDTLSSSLATPKCNSHNSR